MLLLSTADDAVSAWGFCCRREGQAQELLQEEGSPNSSSSLR